MENQDAEKKRGFEMKKLCGVLFTIAFILCGCGVESIFGTSEQQITWVAILVVMVVAAFGLGKGE